MRELKNYVGNTSKNDRNSKKTTKIKPEKNQPRRGRAGADFFLVLFLLFFRLSEVFFFVFVRVANIIFQFSHNLRVSSDVVIFQKLFHPNLTGQFDKFHFYT